MRSAEGMTAPGKRRRLRSWQWGFRILVTAAVLAFFSGSGAAEKIKRFTDPEGSLHITNLGPDGQPEPGAKPPPMPPPLPSPPAAEPPAAPPGAPGAPAVLGAPRPPGTPAPPVPAPAPGAVPPQVVPPPPPSPPEEEGDTEEEAPETESRRDSGPGAIMAARAAIWPVQAARAVVRRTA